MRRAFLCSSAACVAAAALVACGGGGGGSATPPTSGGGSVSATPTPSPSPSASGYAVSGTVVQIPSDAYGPTTIDGVTYASADAGQTTPLVGATVIVGPVPIVGATAPAVLPMGDVAMTTSAFGAFSVTVSAPPSAPSSVEPFVLPANNLSGAEIPTTGYYFEVFGSNSDGVSANVPIPLHRFALKTSPLLLRVSTPSAAESNALSQVNSDRLSNAEAAPLTFDESAEEVARLHAFDEAQNSYYCHYDLHNIGPTSRYLALSGLGILGENLAAPTGVDAAVGFTNAENGFLSEKSEIPQGEHYLNLVDSSRRWAGLAASANQNGVLVDYELVTPNAVGASGAASGYEVAQSCLPGTIDNNS